MRHVLVERMVAALISGGIIKECEKKLYIFGVNQMLLFLINIGTSLIAGIICGMVWQSLLFSAMYIPLRRFAGGYHAGNAGICYAVSTLMVFAVLILMRNIELTFLACSAILLVAGIIILIKAPVESSNKPLSNKEKEVFKKKTRLILIAESLLILLTGFFVPEIAECIILAICCSAVMLILPDKN